MLLDRDFRAVPVIEVDNRVVGIITNGDLVERGGLTARLDCSARSRAQRWSARWLPPVLENEPPRRS
ncbi:MAG TPA: hypothetical protein VGJ60_12900 [Chloroflexota bacterium]|jgi:CBS-domain-containing membrane protein